MIPFELLQTHVVPGTPSRFAVVVLLLGRVVLFGWILTQLMRHSTDNPALAACLSLTSLLLFFASLIRWVFLYYVDSPKFVAPQQGLRVAAVTTFVPQAESLSMLETTLTAMVQMDYPHDTWVLDEGNQESVIRLCQSLGVRHFSRKGKPEYQTEEGRFQRSTKHGNYNAWLTEAGFEHYDVLVGFDPDHIPSQNFLTETLGCLEDSKISYIQSPQEYRNQTASVVAGGCDEESRDFYWISQRAYHRFGSPSVIGAHHVHRMSALKEVGGLAAHVADDLLLTLVYQAAGCHGAYVPVVLAKGLAPDDWATYIKQQRRWARSLLDVKFRVYPSLVSHMPVWTRIVGLLQGLTYLADALSAIFFIAAVVLMLLLGTPDSLELFTSSATFWAVWAVLLLTGLYPRRWHGSHRLRLFYWRAAWVRFAKWPYTLLAVLDVVRGQNRSYDLTSKITQSFASRRFFFWPHLLIAVGLSLSWMTGTLTGTAGSALSQTLAALTMSASLWLVFTGWFGNPKTETQLSAPQ